MYMYISTKGGGGLLEGGGLFFQYTPRGWGAAGLVEVLRYVIFLRKL